MDVVLSRCNRGCSGVAEPATSGFAVPSIEWAILQCVEEDGLRWDGNRHVVLHRDVGVSELVPSAPHVPTVHVCVPRHRDDDASPVDAAFARNCRWLETRLRQLNMVVPAL